jgi:drug/metabolite transporter (DMT)-like permease
MWLLFSILTVLLWGTSDVLFKSVSSEGRTDALKLLAMNGTVYGVCCLIYWAIVGGFSFTSLIQYLPVAAIYIASMLFYYKMLPHIKISIASPIANSSCVLTTLLCVIVLGQRVNAMQAVAILLIVAAIVVLSFDKTEQSPTAGPRDYLIGIGFAMLYFVLDGTASFLDDYMLSDALAGNDVIIAYGIWYLLVGLSAMAIAAKKQGGDRLDFGFVRDGKTLLGCLIETAGQFTYVFAYAYGDAAIASPFIASFSMVSVILSRIFLKEKLGIKQYVLVAMMLAGMFILAIE